MPGVRLHTADSCWTSTTTVCLHKYSLDLPWGIPVPLKVIESLIPKTWVVHFLDNDSKTLLSLYNIVLSNALSVAHADITHRTTSSA